MKQRKNSILAIGLITLILATLQGCGFHLRGSAELPPSISPLYIEGISRHDPVHMALREMLGYSNIQLADSPSAANTKLRLGNHQNKRRVLSTDSAGKVVEYELYQAVEFDLVNSKGDMMVEKQTVSSQQTYENLETEVLGKQEEEAQLRRDISQDLAGKITSRLQAQLK